MTLRLDGVAITEVECRGCGECIRYGDLEHKGECPECGRIWRVVG